MAMALMAATCTISFRAPRFAPRAIRIIQVVGGTALRFIIIRQSSARTATGACDGSRLSRSYDRRTFWLAAQAAEDDTLFRVCATKDVSCCNPVSSARTSKGRFPFRRSFRM